MKKRPTWESPVTETASRITYRLKSLGALHTVMVAKGFTSGYQLAQAAGLGPSTVNHIVHGHRRTASPKTVRGLREALGNDVDALFALDKSQVSEDRAA